MPECVCTAAEPAACRPAFNRMIGLMRAAERSELMKRREFRMPSM
ncbi:MAG: hypothetical protein BWZ07_03137 [Alphaproteobacteria bacterium ADurb.BinA280]|nr:MAG: hypothetical protein BWZ07_03137 [Alphaproteobacteria bacterium ADurb.BinA280]